MITRPNVFCSFSGRLFQTATFITTLFEHFITFKAIVPQIVGENFFHVCFHSNHSFNADKHFLCLRKFNQEKPGFIVKSEKKFLFFRPNQTFFSIEGRTRMSRAITRMGD